MIRMPGFGRLALGRYLAESRGYELVRRNFYSPLPDLRQLPESLWAEPRPMVGVDLRTDSAIALIEEQLAPCIQEFDPPSTRPGYEFSRSSYGPADAETLYALIRYLQPSLVVELGSGASSHFIHAGLDRNGTGEHHVYDPYPFSVPSSRALGPLEGVVVHRERSERLDTAEIASWLSAGDVLFVDTTHTVKTGGDVDRIFLDLLPSLAPGVWIHVHDIFLPYEYPRTWVVDERRAWGEQYLLQALLVFNDKFRVEIPLHAVARAHPKRLTAAVPSFSPRVAPAAFWISRVAQ
jgi:Methyltransferase domain